MISIQVTVHCDWKDCKEVATSFGYVIAESLVSVAAPPGWRVWVETAFPLSQPLDPYPLRCYRSYCRAHKESGR